VFQEWMIRLQTCVDGNGEYVEWWLNWNVQFLFLNGIFWDATLRRNTMYHETLMQIALENGTILSVNNFLSVG
jgi:hypothetical protein